MLSGHMQPIRVLHLRAKPTLLKTPWEYSPPSKLHILLASSLPPQSNKLAAPLHLRRFVSLPSSLLHSIHCKRGQKPKPAMGENNNDGSVLAEFLAVAVEAAKSAGEVIRKGFYETKHVEHKGQVDLVTETDKACEELIFDHLRKHYPGHKFIGEETSAALGTAELTDEPTWIVDPLDGTTNFVHGFPFVCVSIGLAIGKVPTVGVVYNPIIGELFTGVRGQGAFLNGNPMKASSQNELVKALLVTEAGTKRDKATVDATTNRINNLLFKVRSLRMCGSLALNLCGIACGRLDLCYEIGFGGPWDVAAGALIVHEAGGLVFDPSGGDFDLMSRRVAASNSHLKDAFIKVLSET